MSTQIDCPACGQGKILIDPRGLLTGASYSCGTCFARLSASPSSVETLRKGVSGYEALREQCERG